MKVIDLPPGQMLSKEYLYIGIDNKDKESCLAEFILRYPEYSQQVAVGWIQQPKARHHG